MSNNKQTFEYIAKFLNQDGISGFEHQISQTYKAEALKYGAQVTRGGLGSVIAKIGTKGPKLLIGSHLDEVGFVVSMIEESGFIRLRGVGGHWTHSMLGNQIKLVTNDKREYIGVIGSTSVHVLQPAERTKVMDMKDLFVDFGFESAKEAIDAGVKIGDQMINISKAYLMAGEKKYMAKAIDDRIAVALQAKLIERLQGEKLSSQVYLAAAVQEEVGSRGGKAITNSIQPDLAIALDTCVSHDTPNIIPGSTKLGSGVAIQVLDGYAISNPLLVDYLMALAKKHNIDAYKYVAEGGGTDADEFQYSQAGIPVVVISIPTRYLHTQYEVSSIKDFNDTLELLYNFIKEFSETVLNKFTYK